MKEKLEKIYKNSIFLRIIGLSLNIKCDISFDRCTGNCL